MTTRAAIAGWGAAIPEARLTNADLERLVDTSDAWIVERTGVRERRIAGEDETTATLGVAAGAAALKQAGLAPGDVDLLMVATTTPEQPVPETSAFVHGGLGLSCGAFDVGAACSGFVYGLVAGSFLLVGGGLQTVLVVGAETLTRIVDFSDRQTCVLFGDAAGAVVLTAAEGQDAPGLLAWDLGCDGTATALIELRAGGSRLPTSPATLAAGEHWVRMDGPEVFRRAVRIIVNSASATLERAGVAVDEVDLFIPHQANARILAAAASRLGIAPGRLVTNIDRYGNTSAASIPLGVSVRVRGHPGALGRPAHARGGPEARAGRRPPRCLAPAAAAAGLAAGAHGRTAMSRQAKSRRRMACTRRNEKRFALIGPAPAGPGGWGRGLTV